MAKVLSEARLQANRRNAQKSTGPRTTEGKIRARANAVKHGLTGEGLALRGEDLDEVQRRFNAIQAELAPQTVLGTYYAHQIALMTVRTQRAARQETAAIDRQVRRAGVDFQAARLARVQRLFVRLKVEPVVIYRQLLAMPEGVDRLVRELWGLRAGLVAAPVVWPVEALIRLEAACGRRVGGGPPARSVLLARAVAGDFAGLDPAEPGDLANPAERQAWAARELAAWIDAEIQRLHEHRATLDHNIIELHRIEAEDIALFDPGKEAVLARKYEANAARALRLALQDFETVEALGEPALEIEAIEDDDLGELDLEELIADEASPADDVADRTEEAIDAPNDAEVVLETCSEPPASARGASGRSKQDRGLKRSVGSFEPAGWTDAASPRPPGRPLQTSGNHPSHQSG